MTKMATVLHDAFVLMDAKPYIDSIEASGGPRIGMVAVGEAGRAMLTTPGWQQVRLHRTIVVHAEAGALTGTPVDHRILVGTNPACSLAITAAIGDLQMIFLVVAMDSASDVVLATEITRQAGLLNIGVLAFATVAQAGGPHHDALANLPALGLPVRMLLKGDVGAEHCSPASLYTGLCRAISNASMPGNLIVIDFEDLVHGVLDQAGDWALGIGESSGAEGVAVAAQRALAHVGPRLGEGHTRGAAANSCSSKVLRSCSA